MVANTTVIAAFGAEHVQKLTGLSRGQLREWDKAGFFAPTYAYADRRLAHSRVYSFTDVVGLRVINVLRTVHRIALPELKRVAAKLSAYSDTPWASLTLYVLNKEVHFHNPRTGNIESVLTGQIAAALPISSVMEDMRAAADKLRQRDASKVGTFERHRYTARNATVVGGTRIPVSAIYSFTDAGYSPRQILAEYPLLKMKDVRAALAQRDSLTRAA